MPFCAGVRAIRIAECDVNSRILLVLQDFADQILEPDVSADRELAYAVTICVGVSVIPEIVFKFPVLGVSLRQTIALHANRERRVFQVAELPAQIVTHHTVNDESSIHFSGRSEDLASGQIAPLFWRDNTASLEPLVVRIQI